MTSPSPSPSPFFVKSWCGRHEYRLDDLPDEFDDDDRDNDRDGVVRSDEEAEEEGGARTSRRGSSDGVEDAGDVGRCGGRNGVDDGRPAGVPPESAGESEVASPPEEYGDDHFDLISDGDIDEYVDEVDECGDFRSGSYSRGEEGRRWVVRREEEEDDGDCNGFMGETSSSSSSIDDEPVADAMGDPIEKSRSCDDALERGGSSNGDDGFYDGDEDFESTSWSETDGGAKGGATSSLSEHDGVDMGTSSMSSEEESYLEGGETEQRRRQRWRQEPPVGSKAEANRRYRRHLADMQRTANLRREAEARSAVRRQRRRAERRKRLAQVARGRNCDKGGHLGFDGDTAAAVHARTTKKEIPGGGGGAGDELLSPEERGYLEEERADRIGEERRHHKERYKKQVAALRARRREVEEAAERAASLEEWKRDRVRDRALRELSKRSHPDGTKKDTHDDVGRGENLVRDGILPNRVGGAGALRGGDKCIENRSPLEAKKVDTRALREKILMEIATIKEKRQQKEKEEMALERRLKKRELILKSKYDVVHDSHGIIHDNKSAKEAHHIIEERQEVVAPSVKKTTRGARPKEIVREIRRPLSVMNETAKDVRCLSTEEAEAMVKRLFSRKAPNTGDQSPQARDYEDWKRRNGVRGDQRVFKMTGWYPSIRSDLIRRGWFFNEDHDSPYFDLQWTLSWSNVKYDELGPDQMVNHFQRSGAITTKVGLLHTLRNLPFFANRDKDSIFPRSYDLSMSSEVETFVEDFRCVQAESVLRALLKKAHSDEHHTTEECPNKKQVVDQQHMDVAINPGVLHVLLSVLKKGTKDFDDAIDEPVASTPRAITEIEGEVLQHAGRWLFEPVSTKAGADTRPFFDVTKVPTSIDALLRRKHNSSSAPPDARQEASVERRKLEARKRMFARMKMTRPLSNADICVTNDVLRRFQMSTNESQRSINGAGNIWIAKPAGKSRGRGIEAFCDLSKLLHYVDATTGSAQPSHWIVQKYIENPLTIAGRKFDIRQWVLVTNFNPLTVWFYNDCYVRFATEKYKGDDANAMESSSSSPEDQWISDRFRHLVNNSIAKSSSKFHSDFVAENGANVTDHMWPIAELKDVSDDLSEPQFRIAMFSPSDKQHKKSRNEYKLGIFAASLLSASSQWIIHQTGEDKWTDVILDEVKKIVTQSLMCAQGGVITPRKNSWELFGYDIMLDDKFCPWLIEINSSPACDYSTPTAESFVKGALPDILSVVLDYNERSPCVDGDTEDVQVGGWLKIYKGSEVTRRAAQFGTEIVLKGKNIARKRRCKQKEDGKSVNRSTRKMEPQHCNSTKMEAEVELVFDDSDISSDCGVEQGDDCTPCALQPGDVVRQARSEKGINKKAKAELAGKSISGGGSVGSGRTFTAKSNFLPLPNVRQKHWQSKRGSEGELKVNMRAIVPLKEITLGI